MSAIGTPMEDMGYILGCSRETIRNAAKDENGPVFLALSKGRAEGKQAVRQTLWKEAVSGKQPAMTIFYCKTQLGMKEEALTQPLGGGFTLGLEISEDDRRSIRIVAKSIANVEGGLREG